MKKSLICLLFILFTFGLSGSIQAAVSGVCSDCHTMHNSQGGQPMAYELAGTFAEDPTPNPTLLVSDCVGCHSSADADTTQNSGGVIGPIVYNVPIVYNISGPTDEDTLAGGNFYYVKAENQNKGHDLDGISAELDSNFTDAPALIPGSADSYDTLLTCAGTSGCHGDRANAVELAAIKGAHHTDDSGGITGGSVGVSYRFLNGILGTEDSDWEQDNTSSSHNEYKGGTDFPASGTISSLCKQCHGDFHSSAKVGSQSPWSRHPTDIVLPISGEYQYYNGGTTGGTAAAPYSMLAPLARPNPGDVTDTTKINPGTDIVMCLSCHRAHGSPHFKMMRWDNTGGRLGCNVCHTSKK